MVGSECFCFGLAKNISVLVVSLWNRREVDFFGDSSGFGLYCGMELEKNVVKPKRHKVLSTAGTLIIVI